MLLLYHYSALLLLLHFRCVCFFGGYFAGLLGVNEVRFPFWCKERVGADPRAECAPGMHMEAVAPRVSSSSFAKFFLDFRLLGLKVLF